MSLKAMTKEAASEITDWIHADSEQSLCQCWQSSPLSTGSMRVNVWQSHGRCREKNNVCSHATVELRSRTITININKESLLAILKVDCSPRSTECYSNFITSHHPHNGPIRDFSEKNKQVQRKSETVRFYSKSSAVFNLCVTLLAHFSSFVWNTIDTKKKL